MEKNIIQMTEKDYQIFQEKEKNGVMLEIFAEKTAELEKMTDDYVKLNKKYEDLKTENEKLNEEYKNLKHEYSENTVIESMNNMKIQYEELMQTTVPKYKYDNVYEKWRHLYRINNASVVVLEHTIKTLENLGERFLYGGQNRLELEKTKFEVSILVEILEQKYEEEELNYRI